MLATANKNPGERWDIAVVAAPREGNVLFGTNDIVCRIDIQPHTVAAVGGQPRVSRVSSDKPWLARHGYGTQIATDIPGWNTE